VLFRSPILDGTCGMHRQGNFYGANFLTAKPDVTFGADGDVNVFYLPTINSSFGNVTLTGGIYAVAFNDKPETQSAMAFLASADFANARAKAQQSGFLSPNKKIDVNSYGNPLDKQLASILLKASPVRFDGSDAMPASVGAGTFWKEGTNWVSCRGHRHVPQQRGSVLAQAMTDGAVVGDGPVPPSTTVRYRPGALGGAREGGERGTSRINHRHGGDRRGRVRRAIHTGQPRRQPALGPVGSEGAAVGLRRPSAPLPVRGPVPAGRAHDLSQPA